MSVLRRRAILAGATAAVLGAPAIANAQADWPKGTIKFLIPFPPGGSTDPIARIIQAKVIEQTGWNIVVDNKPGGSGVVGAAIAAKAPPDGNTWLIVFDNHILNSLLNDNLPYNDGELTPVMQIGRSAQGIAAHPTRPYNTFAEAIKAAKAEPGKISIGSLGSSLAQIFIAFLQKENGFQMNYIPYKGGGPLYQDALAGVTDLSVTSLANMMPHVRAGKLKLVGVTGEQRSKLAPDTPTLAQQGVKALPSFSWWGVYAPTGTPKPIIDKMHAAISKAVRTEDVTKKFVDQFDMEIVLNSPEAFAAYVKKEQEFWGKVIKDNNLRAG
ncbi:MAG: tripartite tricarboxylate transporter substrate binding protein [Reyranella sp.]|uniref:Bug family tripartite tricarboxylate transporter substrate binding protein n=1 Tax=Reyranella sp. TaxID=1929291 RepID=UPI00121B6F13|nr:tripartite tricarboxylate transporter substrate binding protein [Reyranella sp.]TAJ42028.1 MAG: tripartite tricarboxylate transporter substrate binding protein [Reyranella sp.]